MNIALMAHKNKRGLLIDFCIAYAAILSQHELSSTNTTGHIITNATGLKVNRVMSKKQGGEQQIGARIAYNEIDLVFFFNDPSHFHSASDIGYISHLCDLNMIPFASNLATAEMLIMGLARGDLDWRLSKNSLPTII